LVVLSRATTESADLPRASYEQVRHWRENNGIFEDLAAIRSQPYALRSSDNQSRAVTAHVVSSSFFSVLRAGALVGRVFNASDERAGSMPVVVLNESTWRTVFGGRTDVVGETITLESRRDRPTSYVVVGVVRDDVRLHWLPRPSFFLPDVKDGVRWDPGAVREVIARLRPGVSHEHAAAEFTRLVRSGPFPLAEGRGIVIPLVKAEFGEARGRLRVLVAAVLLVLTLAFVNVAVLLVVLSAERRPEIATRLALGATRPILLRTWLLEQAVFAALAGAAGSVLAVAGTRLAVALSPPDIPRIETATFDVAAGAVAVCVALFLGIVMTLPIVLAATRGQLASALAAPTAVGMRRGHRFRRDVLLVAQLSLVLALIVGAALALHSFWRMYNVELGFSVDRILTAHIWLGAEYELSSNRLEDVQSRILDRVRALPDVESAAFSAQVPTALTNYAFTLPGGRRVSARSNSVTSDYFGLLNIPVVEGRVFTNSDDEFALVVNESFAKQHFSHSAVGETLPASSVNPPRLIVGVVGDTWTGPSPLVPSRIRQQQGPARTSERPPVTYSRFDTNRWRQSDIWLLVRARRGAIAIDRHIAQAIREVDPGIAPDISTLAREASLTRLPIRFYSVLLGIVAVVALILAAIGVAAAGRQAATERMQEIGLRIALGAQASSVRSLMLGRLLVLFVLSVAAGLYLGTLSATGLRSVLFELEETNAATLMGSALILGVIVACGAYGPIHRASRVDPIKALREPTRA
jgi:putative ABC transport system permease protein